jgi:PAS domain S-box-containing protein
MKHTLPQTEADTVSKASNGRQIALYFYPLPQRSNVSVRSDLERISNQMPVAAYLVKENGLFLHANRRLRDILGLSSADIGTRSIAEFYAKPNDREALVAAVRQGSAIEKQTVAFVARDREIQLQMFCNAAYEQNGDFLGYFGVLVEVTAETEYRGLFHAHLPAGVFRLDERDCVTHANLAFARIHGYDDVDTLKGKNVREFHADPSDADKIREQIILQQGVHRQKVILRRADGEEFPAYMSAIPFFNRHQQYEGRGGLVEDRTREEQYERLFVDIPVGFYVVEKRNGIDIIIDCNEEFARIHDLASRELMIGRRALDFHYSADETQRFLDNLAEASRAGGAVFGEPLRIRTDAGIVKTIEISSRPRIRDGVVVGRTSAIRDISAEVELREFIHTLTSDIGAVLHVFRHTLTQLKHSIAAVADVLAGAPKTRAAIRTPEELERLVRGPLHELQSAVTTFVHALNQVSHAVPLDDSQTQKLLRVVTVMQEYQKIPKAHWRDVWRNGVVEVMAICNLLEPKTMARSKYRPVVDAARKMATITGLATLSVAREAIANAEAPVGALYELVTSGIRPAERRTICPIESCVVDAINNLAGFAEEREVRIRFDDRSQNTVSVSRIEITRAIGHLLHNAIKYSWSREDGRTWVSISIDPGGDRVSVGVENWGVPIPADELDGGLIYELGYRGRLSSDRGRMGTGVGVADALRVARAHGGNLRLDSRPASSRANSTNYAQPFVTTASLELPLWKGDE